MKETDWFSLMVIPVRVGVYRTRHRGSDGKIFEGYSNWDGQKWGYTFSNINAAYWKISSPASPQQSREWKGIYKEEA